MHETFSVLTAATSAAISSVLFGYPFDRYFIHFLFSVKTRMQTAYYPSSISCAKMIYSSSGIAGFYRYLLLLNSTLLSTSGVVPVMASVSILRSISFLVYNKTRTATTSTVGLLGSAWVSGGFAGALVVII